MKNSFAQFLVFFIFLIFFALASAVLYVVYVNCLGLDSGQFFIRFPARGFVYGLLYMLPFGAVFALISLFFFLIRHPSNAAVSAAVWAVLALFVWVVCIPVSFKLKEGWGLSSGGRPAFLKEFTVDVPSAGYFRPEGTSSYYWNSVGDGGTGSGIVAARDSFSAPSVFSRLAYDADSSVLLSPDGTPLPELSGKDILIRGRIQMPRGLSGITAVFRGFFERGEEAFGTGPGAYLCFASALFGIAALWPLCRMTGWRLLNVTLTAAGFYAVILLNEQLYASPFFLRAAAVVSGFFPAPCSEWVRNFFPVVFNVCLLVFMSVAGGLLWWAERLSAKGKHP